VSAEPEDPVDTQLSRRELRASDRRAQVLYAAARVISERGAERTRLVDVARAAKVSTGLIQHYFSSRDELLSEAFEFCTERWLANWEQMASSESDPISRLLVLLHMACFEMEGWREVQWRIWIEFWSLCDRDPAFRAQYAGHYDRFRGPFYDSIREGVECGCFTICSHEDDVVDRLTATIEGLRLRALLQPDRMPRQRMFELIVAEASEQLGATLPATRGLT
jgi:AcrR family transcriptional regulator